MAHISAATNSLHSVSPAAVFTLAFPSLDGVYLPKQESEFVHLVLDELETFKKEDKHNRVLLFPPLSSRLRFLIHRTVEDLPQLCSFSVGESWCRRVVVCFTQIRGEIKDDSNVECSSLPEHHKESEEMKPKCLQRNRIPKRPDQPLYTPRAVRLRLSKENHDFSNHESTLSSHEEEKSSLTDRIHGHGDGPPFCEPAEEKDLEEVRDEVVCETSDRLKEDGCDSEDVPNICSNDDTGADSDTEELSEELKAHLKGGVCVHIELVHGDFSSYESVSVNTEDFSHVIEIYDFPPLFKTDDLLDAFTEYSEGGMKIKWVDNTHALGIFSCEAAALHALSISHPLLKARALSQGSKKAKGKAIRRAEFLQPVKERPRTDSAVARRMVTRALGLQSRGRGQRY